MKRRAFVALLSATFSGCISGSREDSSESGDEVSLSSEDVTAANPGVSLIVEYSEEVLYEVRTQEGRHTPDDGTKFLMVRTRITNVGDSKRNLTARQYVLVADGERYEPVLVGSEGYVSEKVIPSGTRTKGWLLFQIPQEVSEAILTAAQEEIEPVFSVEFSRNPGIEGVMG